MSSAVANVLRAAGRGDDLLNILFYTAHERMDSMLCKTGHRFWGIHNREEIGVKPWKHKYAAPPENLVLLNPENGDRLPPDVSFDLIIAQHRFGHAQHAIPLSRRLHVPLIIIEHTLPPDNWSARKLADLKKMRGSENIFISEYSRNKWGWNEGEAFVIHHGVDAELFSPNDTLVNKKHHVLGVCNDFVNRNWCCGYDIWKETTKGVPIFLVGDTPGLSKPAASVHELVMRYREASVFLNTSLVSPVPTSLLEAMAVGLPVVSTATAMIPEVIQHEVNGLLSNDPNELRSFCKMLLKDAGLRQRLGDAGRRTILEKFSLEKFVSNWRHVIHDVVRKPYNG